MTGFNNISERFLLDLIFELAGAACWVIDEQGGVFWDDRLYDLYEMEHGEGINMQAFQDKVYPKDLLIFNQTIESALEAREPFEVNVRILIKGSFRWIRIIGAPSGSNMIGVTQDIDKLFRETEDTRQLLNMIKALSVTGSKSGEAIKKLLVNSGR